MRCDISGADLFDLFVKHDAKKTRNTHLGFADFYATVFGEVGDIDGLMEIGIQHGGSIRAWHEAMPWIGPSRLIGVDDSEEWRVSVPAEIATTYTQDQEAELPLADGCLSVIIDDASHRVGKTIATARTHWRLLRPGGAYVIEDVGYTVNWQEFTDQTERVEWFQWLAEIIRRQGWPSFTDHRCILHPEFAGWVPVVSRLISDSGIIAFVKG